MDRLALGHAANNLSSLKFPFSSPCKRHNGVAYLLGDIVNTK